MTGNGPQSSDPNGREPTLPGGGRPSREVDPAGIAITVQGRTAVGLVREHNEDNYLVADLTSGDHASASDVAALAGPVAEHGYLLAVCDGMGGAAAGEVASQMAVDAILETMMDGVAGGDRDAFARRLVRAVEEAGNRIYGAAKMDRSRRGMGTTATVAGLRDRVLFVGQVGDSRAYVFRSGELVQITKDQSLVNQLVEAGQLTEEEAEGFEHSNIILQALGTTEEVQVDLTFLELRRGDVLMLCSDGLSGLVHGDLIRETLEAASDLEEATAKLVDMANSGGGHDNITVLCARFDGEELPPPEDPAVLRPSYQQYPLPPDDGPGSVLPSASRNTRKVGAASKPGADVKRAAADPVRRDEEEAPTVPVQRFPWWWVAVGLVLAGAVAALAFAAGGEGDAATASGVVAEDVGPDPSAAAAPAADEPVTVVVRTDIEGAALWIDGRRNGALEDGMTLRVPPGPRRFVARVDGTDLAAAETRVQAGEPVRIELRMPRGLGTEERAEPLPEEIEQALEAADESRPAAATRAPAPDPGAEGGSTDTPGAQAPALPVGTSDPEVGDR